MIQTIKEQLSSDVPGQMREIIDCHFSFDNSELLDSIEERAQALKAADLKKLKLVQEKITELKNNKFDKLVTPNYMWVTFENDLAIHAAIKKKKFTFGEHAFAFKRA